jgi:Mg/Co/Ni transporter MgtE|tara:strand:+ start:282 stop:458 length:177 start_codon:yes stop_codon:yes gene_type:complete
MKININFEIDESSAADREKAEEVITLLSDIREILNELNSDKVIDLLESVNKKRRTTRK